MADISKPVLKTDRTWFKTARNFKTGFKIKKDSKYLKLISQFQNRKLVLRIRNQL